MMTTWIFLSLWGCATHTVAGSVQGIDNLPIGNAACIMFEQQAISNEKGEFEFNNLNLKKGEYPIQCTLKGYEFHQQMIVVEGPTATISPIVLKPLEVQIPYLRINLDPEGELLPSK